MKDAKEILKDIEDSTERESLEKQVADIEHRWKNIVAKAETRDGEIAQVIPVAKRCQLKVQDFTPKVAELEKKVQDLPSVAVEKEDLKKQVAKAKEIREEIDDLMTVNDEMTESCNTLVGNPLADLNVVAAEVENLKARYVMVLERVSDWQQKVNHVEEQVAQYEEAKKPVEEKVTDVEETIPVYNLPVADAETAKSELTTVEKSIQELDGLCSEKSDVTKIGSGILKHVGEESPRTAVLKESMATLDKRFNGARERAVKRKIFLESQLKRLVVYEDTISQVETWIAKTLLTLDKQEPISTKPEKLAEQLEEAKVLQDEMVKEKQVVETALEAGQWLAENTADVEQRNNIVGRMTKTRANFDRVAKRVDDRYDRLQLSELKSRDVQDVFDEFSEELRKLEEEFESQRPVSAVRETLDEQKRKTDVSEHHIWTKLFSSLTLETLYFFTIQSFK